MGLWARWWPGLEPFVLFFFVVVVCFEAVSRCIITVSGSLEAGFGSNCFLLFSDSGLLRVALSGKTYLLMIEDVVCG